MNSIERHILLHAPVAQVWEAFTDSRLMSGWFGAEVWLEPRVGGRVTIRQRDGSARRAIVEHLITERVLVIRWLPFEEAKDGTRYQRPPSTVRFVLTPQGDDTELDVIESFASPAADEFTYLPTPLGGSRHLAEGPQSEPQARAAL